MRRLWRGLGWTVGVLLVVAVVLRILVLDVWIVSDDAYLGASAAPTLAGGDLLILNRRGTPGFGDLVRCTDPQDSNAFVIGRIAGVEGDTVEVEGHRLRVNGRSYDSESACADAKVRVRHPETQKE